MTTTIKELTAEEIMEPLRKWYASIDDQSFDAILVTFNHWLDEGKHIAVYENVELGHPQLGHRKYYSCGSSTRLLQMAQFSSDPPERLPDFPTEINWRYKLVGVFKGRHLSRAPVMIATQPTMPMGTSGPVGVWRHWRGSRYLVLGLATDSNNVDPRTEPQVVYVSMESQGRGPNDWPMHTRSLSEFYERFSPEALGPERKW